MSEWPEDFPDPEEIKRLKKQAQAPPWPAAGDMPRSAKQGKPPKEKILPTWGIPVSPKRKGRPAVPEYQPEDKAALKRQREDAEWAARQQRGIAKANQRQAKAARRARDWQAATDREIAEANRHGYAADYPAAEPGGCFPAGGCLSSCATIPVWLIILLVLVILIMAWSG